MGSFNVGGPCRVALQWLLAPVVSCLLADQNGPHGTLQKYTRTRACDWRQHATKTTDFCFPNLCAPIFIGLMSG